MPIRHTVRRGDSLWALAHQYLGDGTKYPQIYDYHNKEVARTGRRGRLFPIEDPGLIYVSQVIIIPTGEKSSSPGNGTKSAGGKRPLPVNLKVQYTIGRDTPRIRYVEPGLDYTIATEMTGTIAVEIMSADRYRHSLELLVSKDPIQVKQKLGEIYDPVLCNLTAKPEMVYESGRVKIQAAAQANMGPYTVTVEADAPNHMIGRLTSLPVTSTMRVDGREYKYSAELEFIVEVFWQPRPNNRPLEPAKVMAPNPEKDTARVPQNSAIDWEKIAKETNEIITMVAWTIVGTAMIWYTSTMSLANQTTSMGPFMHTINPLNPRHTKYADRNPGII